MKALQTAELTSSAGFLIEMKPREADAGVLALGLSGFFRPEAGGSDPGPERAPGRVRLRPAGRHALGLGLCPSQGTQ